MSHSPTTETLRLPLGRAGGGGSSLGRRLLAASLVVGAIGVGAVAGQEWVRAVIAAGLVALAAAVHHRAGVRKAPPQGWLVVDDTGVRRAHGDALSTVLRWDEPFGVTLFASADRATLLMAFTSPHATRFVSAYRRRDDAPVARTAFERAATTADCDLPADEASALSASDADALLAEVGRRTPAAFDRVYLSDASGEPLTLDRAELRIGSKRIDLSAPLEWRAFLFQERGVQAASVCQATWVRQGDVEIVLVAPMPGDGGWLGSPTASPDESQVPRDARQTLARDMRLMQATAGDPPPRELRRAIDRVFMLPMRRALDGAPRAAKARASFESLSGSS